MIDTLFELPDTTIQQKAIDELKKARQKAFKWKDCADVDERLIRHEIAVWLKADWATRPNFAPMLRSAIWKANNKGRTIKYLHFNERNQSLRIDNDFWKWAELVTEQIESQLEKLAA